MFLFNKSINRIVHWKFFLYNIALALLILTFKNSNAQIKTTRLDEIKGTKFFHPIFDKDDTLSSQEIVELRNPNGRPIWFSREILKNVCLSGKCKIVRIRLYWNGTVNYAGFELINNEPLTKTDHVVFNDNDYKKLDEILADTHSVLKNLELKDLIVELPEKKNTTIDGFSGATLPALQEYVVENAVYTCYTLWHTVYGNSRNKIDEILEQRVDSNYLKLIFKENDLEYLIWAINFVGKHPKFQQPFYSEILNLIKSESSDLSGKSLEYFGKPSILSDVNIQLKLVNLLKDVSSNTKFDIIRLLSSHSNVDKEIILFLLDLYETNQISPVMLGVVYKMIDLDDLKDIRILEKLKNISNDQNLYVKNITQKLLSKIQKDRL